MDPETAFLVMAFLTVAGGIAVIYVALKPTPGPVVRYDAWRRPHVYASPRRSKMLRALLAAVGLVLIAAPFAFYAWIRSLEHIGYSKGRVLRIRNRGQLPAVAHGDGWAGEPVVVTGELTAAERRALGELWLITARMEHASVAAFSQLSLQLSALAAPARLLEATHQAALDEIRHARRCFAIVHAITGVEHTAGPIAALVDRPRATIDPTRLAVGSLVDGCLAEGIAADVAARAAEVASEPAIVDALTMIARDEARHAELAWEVLAWCLATGDAGVRAAVAARVEVLDRELSPQLPPLDGVDPQALRRFGVIDQAALGAIGQVRVAAVQARARALLGCDSRDSRDSHDAITRRAA